LDVAERTWHLDVPVAAVRFVDGERAKILDRLGISTLGDLLTHYPHRYLDLSSAPSMQEVRVGTDATVVGVVHEVRVKSPRPRFTITEVGIVDGTGVVIGVWFNQPYVAKRYTKGQRVAFAGRVEHAMGLKQIKNPYAEILDENEGTAFLGGILPVHPASEGLSANWVRRLVTEALAHAGHIPDPLPASIRLQRGLTSLDDALHGIHFPMDESHKDRARRRLAYDELFYMQLHMAIARARRHASGGIGEPGSQQYVDSFCSVIDFPLTPDQKRAVDDVLSDMRSGHPMDRLILGDVGTGKTIVAGFAIAVAADASVQTAMMAPTEVLAEQYSRALGPLLDKIGISWMLLTGSTPASERRSALAGLSAGEVQVAFGTHALFSEDVRFASLGLAIVDEQHRFGVLQRLQLRQKGESSHLLVMTATPIPRTLALTMHGDLDTSVMRDRPGGISPDAAVETRLVSVSEREDAYDLVRSAVGRGRQAFVICALVDASDDLDVTAATTEALRLQSEVFPDLRVGLLTGQMHPEEKRQAMNAFREHELDILVSTTVVEVGVDIPNATVMIVEDAERYGLAQLHQLRGRVTRGAERGLFLVFADPKTAEVKARLRALVDMTDGFRLAEEDLRLRGQGEILGHRQSGFTSFKLASLVDDMDLLVAAREDARAVADMDPDLIDPVYRTMFFEMARRLPGSTSWVGSG